MLNFWFCQTRRADFTGNREISTNEDEHLRFGFASITKSRNDLAGTHGEFLELEDAQAAAKQRQVCVNSVLMIVISNGKIKNQAHVISNSNR